MARESLTRTLRWVQRGLLAIGLSALGYCAYVVGDTWFFQHQERHHFDQLLAVHPANAVVAENAPTAVKGDLIGVIRIPRLGLSVIVIEGTTARILQRAAGHISGTALPGHPGNVGIAAHRDTFFLPLENIHTNDTIMLITLLGEYRYRVVSTRIVSPADVAVLNRSENEVLTLVTCYPFHFVGAAPNRFIVRAERIA